MGCNLNDRSFAALLRLIGMRKCTFPRPTSNPYTWLQDVAWALQWLHSVQRIDLQAKLRRGISEGFGLFPTHLC